jgi:hypothetical protein
VFTYEEPKAYYEKERSDGKSRKVKIIRNSDVFVW